MAMAVLEWRGQKLRLDTDGIDLTLKQARVIKRFTGLRVVAFQTALQDMVKGEDLDPDLMQAFLWLLLDQNGRHADIADLDDVTFEELTTALGSLTQDGVPPVVDPTSAADESVLLPPNSSSSSSTPTLTGNEPSTSSSSPTTAASAL